MWQRVHLARLYRGRRVFTSLCPARWWCPTGFVLAQTSDLGATPPYVTVKRDPEDQCYWFMWYKDG
jgi:hypothetical protein